MLNILFLRLESWIVLNKVVFMRHGVDGTQLGFG